MEAVSPVLVLSVLLVAPSASLAGPLPSPAPTTVPNDVGTVTNNPAPTGGALPWGQGVIVAGGNPQQPISGYIYCAGCSPLQPGQLVIPGNVPLAQALSASGVIPPQLAKAVQQDGGSLEDLQQLNAEEPGKGQKIWDDSSVPVQQMALHDDGRYSFSYNTAHSTRQEERNLDGSVSGSYSYTDPDGKLVQIDYTAGPNQGYQAVGENVPPQPALPLPQPVQDTLEVQRARQEHLEAFNRELERIQRDQEAAAAAAATASTPAPGASSSTTPSSSEVTGEENSSTGGNVQDSETDNSNDDAIVVAGKTEPVGQDEEAKPVEDHAAREGITDEQTDSIVINAKEQTEQQNVVAAKPPSAAYQITIPYGGAPGGVVEVRAQEDGQQKQNQQQNLHVVPPTNVQPYFYYVSVGGQPHYVTSQSSQPGYNSPYPTSLKASLLGAVPLAAVHDAQVPKQTNNAMSNENAALRPVFLDLDNGLKLDQQQQQQPQQTQQQVPQQQQQQQVLFNPASLFNFQNQNVNPSLGQLIPFQLSPANGATFGYIPALILNNNNNGNGNTEQGIVAPGSQSPVMVNMPFQQQQQQQQANPQSVIVLASKK